MKLLLRKFTTNFKNSCFFEYVFKIIFNNKKKEISNYKLKEKSTTRN